MQKAGASEERSVPMHAHNAILQGLQQYHAWWNHAIGYHCLTIFLGKFVSCLRETALIPELYPIGPVKFSHERCDSKNDVDMQ